MLGSSHSFVNPWKAYVLSFKRESNNYIVRMHYNLLNAFKYNMS